MTMTTAADVMRRRLRAPLITLVVGALALAAFAAALDRRGQTNEVQAFAGQATEASAKEDKGGAATSDAVSPTTTTAEEKQPTSARRSRGAPAPTQAAAAPSTASSETTAAPTTAAPTTEAPTTAAPSTAAPTTAAPTTAAPTTTLAPTTAAPTTEAPTTTLAPTTAAPTTAPSGPSCDPNYSGCVPIASDVDCAGGSGNGPEYVQGPINVIGTDIYGLDSDNDGIACE